MMTTTMIISALVLESHADNDNGYFSTCAWITWWTERPLDVMELSECSLNLGICSFFTQNERLFYFFRTPEWCASFSRLYLLTACPGSLVHFYEVSIQLKLDMTFWTYSMCYILRISKRCLKLSVCLFSIPYIWRYTYFF